MQSAKACEFAVGFVKKPAALLAAGFANIEANRAAFAARYRASQPPSIGMMLPFM